MNVGDRRIIARLALFGAVAAAAVVVVLAPWSGSAAGAPGAVVALGRVDGGMRLRLELPLAERNAAALDRLIASGRTVSPASFATRFLPSAGAVGAVIRQLARNGLAATWTPGSHALEVTTSAAAAEREFGVRIERYRGPQGAYYAPIGIPQLRGPLRGIVAAVSGLDDRTRVSSLASSPSDPAPGCGAQPDGYTPPQIMSAYNISPLVNSGLNGTGQTVVMLEIDTFQQSDLDCFGGRFGGAPVNVTVAPNNWGTPSAPGASGLSEAELDLEIVHSIAPAARLVVYNSDDKMADLAAAAQAAVNAYPHAILSVSIGSCEIASVIDGQAAVSPAETAFDAALRQLAATGGSAFISSGDSGAYTCGDRITSTLTGREVPTVSFPASDPYATAVGGTALFVGAGGSYAGEAAWSGPFQANGTGGGVSRLWHAATWQTGPGVSNQYSNGYREVPDVAAVGDPNTGWATFQSGNWAPAGGTSAAAPLWAALTALTDQSLSHYNLSPVGFASVPLYAFGSNRSAWPAPAFNDVTRGNNLYYAATPGWDYTTGWGSPNGAGLVDDMLAYRERHR
jgi:kumamolisin